MPIGIDGRGRADARGAVRARPHNPRAYRPARQPRVSPPMSACPSRRGLTAASQPWAWIWDGKPWRCVTTGPRTPIRNRWIRRASNCAAPTSRGRARAKDRPTGASRSPPSHGCTPAYASKATTALVACAGSIRGATLNMVGLARNRRRQRGFIRPREYKAAWNGVVCRRIDRGFPRSPLCCRCGAHMNRDPNAARNIRDYKAGVCLWRPCKTDGNDGSGQRSRNSCAERPAAIGVKRDRWYQFAGCVEGRGGYRTRCARSG